MTRAMTKSPSDIAAEVLPCDQSFRHNGHLLLCDPEAQQHLSTCPAVHRPAVATAIETAIREERQAIAEMFDKEADGIKYNPWSASADRIHQLRDAANLVRSRSKEGE